MPPKPPGKPPAKAPPPKKDPSTPKDNNDAPSDKPPSSPPPKAAPKKAPPKAPPKKSEPEDPKDDNAPPEDKNNSTPPPKKQPADDDEKNDAPADEKQDEKPADNKEDEKPADDKKDDAPPPKAAPKKAPPKAPPKKSEPEDPKDDKKDDAPADDKKDDPPPPKKDDSKDTSSTANDKPADKEDEKPADEKPADEKKDEKPADEKKDEKPADEKKDDPPPPKKDDSKDSSSTPPPKDDKKTDSTSAMKNCPFPLNDPSTVEVRFSWHGELLTYVKEISMLNDPVRVDLYEEVGRWYNLQLFDLHVEALDKTPGESDVNFAGAFRLRATGEHGQLMEGVTRYLNSNTALRLTVSRIREIIPTSSSVYSTLFVDKIYFPKEQQDSTVNTAPVSERGKNYVRPALTNPTQNEFGGGRNSYNRDNNGWRLQRPAGGFAPEDLILGSYRPPGRGESPEGDRRYRDAPAHSQYSNEEQRSSRYYDDHRSYHYNERSNSPTSRRDDPYSSRPPVRDSQSGRNPHMIEYYSSAESDAQRMSRARRSSPRRNEDPRAGSYHQERSTTSYSNSRYQDPYTSDDHRRVSPSRRR